MIDRLIEAIQKKQNPSVVGLDPTMEMMPEFLKRKYLDELGPNAGAVACMFAEFNKNVIDAVADIVPAVKPQIAMYEAYGLEGLAAYDETCVYAMSRGLLVIGDSKRGDISSTASAYAAHLGGVEVEGHRIDTWFEDAVTVNPYMGSDGIRPYLDILEQRDKGIFVLVKTSNPGSAEIQDLVLQDGSRVYEKTAALVSEWGADQKGRYGYSRVGAVVGATHREEGTALRKAMPHTFFLVPGYGAQGAGAEDVAGFFDSDGLGAIINSSRGITQAWKKTADLPETAYADAAREAALKMRGDLRRVLHLPD